MSKSRRSFLRALTLAPFASAIATPELSDPQLFCSRAPGAFYRLRGQSYDPRANGMLTTTIAIFREGEEPDIYGVPRDLLKLHAPGVEWIWEKSWSGLRGRDPVPNQYEIGWICSDVPGPSPEIQEGMNWLHLGSGVDIHEEFWSAQSYWKLSGPEGWSTDVWGPVRKADA